MSMSEAERIIKRQGRLVRDGWYQYVERVLPPNASATQKAETRRAFYAGAWHVLSTMQDIGEPDISEDQGVAILESIKTEILGFLDDVKAGRA